MDLAVSAQTDAVLVAGDLFDCPDPGPDEVSAVTAGVSRLVEAGQVVAVVPGAYDGLCRSSCFYLAGVLPDACRVVDWPTPDHVPLEVGDETLHLYGFAATPGRTPAEPFAALRRGEGDGYHVGLVHARLEDEPPAPVRIADWGRPELTLAEAGLTGLDLLVVGGGHEFRSEICGVVPLVQPGSPLALHPGDDPSRSFTVANLGPEGVEIERHACASRPAPAAGEAEPAAAEPCAGDRALVDRFRDETGVRGLFVRRLETLLEETDDPARREVLERALALGIEEFNRLEASRAG